LRERGAAMKIKSESDLKKISDEAKSKLVPSEVRIQVGTATCGLAKRAKATKEVLESEVKRQKLKAKIIEVGCNGMCYQEPIVDVIQKGKPKITYGTMTVDKVAQLVKALKEKTVLKENLLFRTDEEEILITDEKASYVSDQSPEPLQEVTEYHQYPFYQKQKKIVLRNSGLIDPRSIEEYIACGGYRSLAKALTMSAEYIIKEVTDSGLRGRGGAGFPTGAKWKACQEVQGDTKYVIANGSEGDPDIGMHRSMLEGDPHSVLEGMMIAAYAVGASRGYLYVSNNYPLALENSKEALRQAKEYGLLGENILGSSFSFEVEVDEGGGAYVCGEETALITSLEGNYGEPRPRPPFPAQKGLWDQPTVVNNIETLANIPVIIAKGGNWFSSIGTKGNTGTKVISLNGSINNSCLIEVPLGMSLKDIIKIGGGVSEGKKFKALTTGGPSGGVLPAKLASLPLNYDELGKAGSLLGSGITVIDNDVNMVELTRYFMSFFKEETCGKCTTCREGVKKIHEILEEICQGHGEMEDIPLLERMSQPIIDGSLCALGKAIPNAVLSTIKHFKNEYKDYIKGKKVSN
jgi:NADH:ubiquinone oxidoreductase subunit F (NADH-binding)/(2Fe-2S) ferredoxin